DRDRVAAGAGERQRAVLVHGLRRRHAVDRGVVHRVDGDVDGGRAGAAVAVGDGVGEAGGAVVVGGRREHDVAAAQRHGAVGAALDRCAGATLAVDDGVGGEAGGGRGGGGGLLLGRGRGGVGDRGVVHRVHGDGDGRRRAAAVAVGDRVGEAGGAVV